MVCIPRICLDFNAQPSFVRDINYVFKYKSRLVLLITVVLLHKIFPSETSTNNALKGATEATC